MEVCAVCRKKLGKADDAVIYLYALNPDTGKKEEKALRLHNRCYDQVKDTVPLAGTEYAKKDLYSEDGDTLDDL